VARFAHRVKCGPAYPGGGVSCPHYKYNGQGAQKVNLVGKTCALGSHVSFTTKMPITRGVTTKVVKKKLWRTGYLPEVYRLTILFIYICEKYIIIGGGG